MRPRRRRVRRASARGRRGRGAGARGAARLSGARAVWTAADPQALAWRIAEHLVRRPFSIGSPERLAVTGSHQDHDQAGPTEGSLPTVGFVGLGRMGWPMARN